MSDALLRARAAQEGDLYAVGSPADGGEGRSAYGQERFRPLLLRGPALVLGDQVNTDELHPSTYYSLDAQRVRAGFLKHVKGLDSESPTVLPGQLVLAGTHLGIGSSRETGAQVFVLAGVQAVVAVSFARIFQRNLLNLGVLALCCPALAEHTRPKQGVDVSLWVQADGGRLEVEGLSLPLLPLDPYWWEVVRAGGLLARLSPSSPFEL